MARDDQVIHIDEHRPHLVLDCMEYALEGEPRVVDVVPIALVLNWISGEVPLPESEPWVLRKIIAEWLMCVKAGCIEHAQQEASD